MSVKGFYINGEVKRYDYDALENKPNDEGLSEAAKTAILQLAEKVAYVDANGQTYYQALYDAFYGNFVNVTNTLTGCYSSNTATTTQQNAAYTATITANPGYTLTGATVSITMGGTSVTGSYSNGTINIPNVTGDLVITVAAVSAVASISAVYTQSGTVYDTDTLDSLKTDLVVTATYSDSSTQTVPAADYTLSGTLTEGTSTITVFYGGKTTTFNATVTRYIPSGYVTDGLVFFLDGKSKVNTNSWTDLIGDKVFALTNCTLANNGVVFDGSTSYGEHIGRITSDWTNETIEVVFEGAIVQYTKTLFSQPFLDNSVGISMRFGDHGGGYVRVALGLDGIARTVYCANINETKSRLSGNGNAVVYNEAVATLTHSTNYSKNTSGNTYVGAGRLSGEVNANYAGTIYAVRIYNRKLTQAEIITNQQNDVVYYGL